MLLRTHYSDSQAHRGSMPSAQYTRWYETPPKVTAAVTEWLTNQDVRIQCNPDLTS